MTPCRPVRRFRGPSASPPRRHAAPANLRSAVTRSRRSAVPARGTPRLPRARLAPSPRPTARHGETPNRRVGYRSSPAGLSTGVDGLFTSIYNLQKWSIRRNVESVEIEQRKSTLARVRFYGGFFGANRRKFSRWFSTFFERMHLGNCDIRGLIEYLFI